MRHSDKRQVFDGLRGFPSRGCALQLDIVEEKARGRHEARNREAGRRRDGTTHDPGRAASKASHAAAYPNQLQFPPAAHSGLRQRYLSRGHVYRPNLFRGCACVSQLCLLK